MCWVSLVCWWVGLVRLVEWSGCCGLSWVCGFGFGVVGLVVGCWLGWVLLVGLVADVLVGECVADGFVVDGAGWMCSKELGA